MNTKYIDRHSNLARTVSFTLKLTKRLSRHLNLTQVCLVDTQICLILYWVGPKGVLIRTYTSLEVIYLQHSIDQSFYNVPTEQKMTYPWLMTPKTKANLVHKKRELILLLHLYPLIRPADGTTVNQYKIDGGLFLSWRYFLITRSCSRKQK